MSATENPTFEVLWSYHEFLNATMPGLQDQEIGIPVFYSHPGDRFQGDTLVWFDDIQDTYEVHSLRATSRKRLIKCSFSIFVACHLRGESLGGQLQYECDQRVSMIRAWIDDDIAKDQHLHREDLVDVAQITNTRTERGNTDVGCGTRTEIIVSFDARFVS